MLAGGFKIWHISGVDYFLEHGHMAAGFIAAIVMITGSILYRIYSKSYDPKTAVDEDFVPPSNLGIRNLFDLVGEFVQTQAKNIIGDHYATYLPLLIFIFLWTWINNLLGSIPTLGSSTDNLNMTLAMGVVAFLYYNYQGVRAHGWKYYEQFTGHVTGILLLLMGPVLFVIETISHLVRPLTLGIRLRSNIHADHSVFGVISQQFMTIREGMAESMGGFGEFLGTFIAALGPIPILLLGLLVATIQAFVFLLLTTVYIGMATAHEEH